MVRVRGRSRRRMSIAAPTCYRPGRRSRLVYRPRRDDGRRDGRESFVWRDHRDLLIAAHQQLGGPIALVRDNLNVRRAAEPQEWATTQDWPTSPFSATRAPRRHHEFDFGNGRSGVGGAGVGAGEAHLPQTCVIDATGGAVGLGVVHQE